MSPTFRPSRDEDLSRLQAIRQAAFAPVFASFAAITGERIAAVAFDRADAEQAALLDELSHPKPGRHLIVAMLGEEIIGFAACTLDEAARLGEIGLNAVHPDHAGRGLGTAMYRHILGLMRDAGMEVAAVSTGGDPSHAPARRAYAKVGFGAPIPSVSLYRTL
jgi:GNAT superfamily N-acetyltransferase